MKSLNKILAFFILGISVLFNFASVSAQKEPEPPLEVRFVRLYGDDNEPPILLMKSQGATAQTNVGANTITLEIDIYANIPPTLFATFVHCDMNWQEDANNFINNQGLMRTSDFYWESAANSFSYYSYRGTLKFPNSQLKFRYSGNWKVKLFDYYSPDKSIAEARFFVVEPIVPVQMDFVSSMYNSEFNVINSAFNIEADIVAPAKILNSQLKNFVIYRNFRWNEPYVISESYSDKYINPLYKYTFPIMVSGFSNVEKRFSIFNVPAENVYRVLDMTNLAQYPTGSYLVQMPFSDLIRNGNYWDVDDDGAMITRYVSGSDDNYVYMEFLLDPVGIISDEDVFVSGSFNNWTPDKNWQMYFDKSTQLYRLKQWVRRARHNYLYGTGTYNADTQKFENISFDRYEGNNVYSNHSFIGLVYYRSFDLGGYDAIIGASITNPFGTGYFR